MVKTIKLQLRTCHSRLGPVGLCEGRHHLGVLRDEGRVDAGLLQKVPHEFIHQPCDGARGTAVDIVLHAQSLQELGHAGVLQRGESNSHRLLHAQYYKE